MTERGPAFLQVKVGVGIREREHAVMRRLLDRLLAARARRDREERFSEPWRAADTELHAIEQAIFRAPLDEAGEPAGPFRPAAQPRPDHAHEARAAATRRAPERHTGGRSESRAPRLAGAAR